MPLMPSRALPLRNPRILSLMRPLNQFLDIGPEFAYNLTTAPRGERNEENPMAGKKSTKNLKKPNKLQPRRTLEKLGPDHIVHK
jgi:hypothetical protein